ncbi:MAG: hypothetical protein M3067_05695 [Chloroflexota bacterium]|nr:hypothetical protein [Chloroflexota bacterium]
MPNPNRLPLLVCLTLLVAGCAASVGPSSSPVGSASPPPSVAPTITGIDHPTGATDVVLRVEEGGGFIRPDFLLTQGPIFTLYGDGTVIFRDNRAAPPQSNDGIGHALPYRTARLTEQQLQALLDQAINGGTLGIARANYNPGTIADAPTTTFTLKAGGLNKTVSAVALGIDVKPGPDTLTLTALAKLADRLRQFDQGGTFATDVYKPSRYRGSLWDSGFVPGTPPKAWPWPNIKPADFTAPADPNALTFPRRTLTADEAAQLAIADFEGGLQQVFLKGPDGKAYSFALRPLLPDEPA